MPHSTAANNRPTQAAIIPPASRWSVSQRRGASSTYRIPTPRRTPHRSAQPPYYNNVYKGAGVRPCYESMPDGAAYHRPCQPGGVDRWQVLHPAHLLRGQCLHLYSVNPATVSTLLTPGGLRSGTGQQSERTGWHPPLAGQSSSMGAAGGAEPLAACAASLFGLSPDSQ